jgi:guanosine-3',5'-bis(diphosphate) 3'-pyrophosphohydrolase
MILQQYQQLKKIVGEYLPPEQIARIDQAFNLASNAHEGQFRTGGEPYITHPVTVACTLARYHLDYETIMAGILHDVVEDTPVTKEQLQKFFGSNVSNLVAGVTKLDKIQFSNYKEAQVANLRKMVMAMVQDIRVIIIKLADRMHNMQTLRPLRPDKRRRIAKETLEIYTPLANRLGMHAIKDKLEALCFENIYPFRSKTLSNAVNHALSNRKTEIESIVADVYKELEKRNIKGRIFCRDISIFNIYRKLQTHKLEFHGVLDNYCFTVIVNDIDTCYRVLGIIHSLYKPKPNSFKDYIAVPKRNGYQSIHTALIGPHGMPIEMLIRTEFMNAMSEMGVLARWSYNTTDDKTSSAVMQQAQRWMNNLLELQENAGNAFEFVEGVKDDLFPDEIYVFTPEGNILELPMGSTPIDFAYAIHTDIGQTCIGARVDHQPYPLSWKLVSGQSVEIITSPTGRPNTSWLNFVVTSRARTKIKQYLNNLAADEAIVLGRRIVLNSVSFRSISEIPQDKMNLILRETKHSDCNELFRDIALGNEMSLLVVQKILGQSSRSDPTSYGMPTDKKFPIRGTFGLLINFAQCCQPVPGDEIVAQVTSGKGLIIHRCECTQLKHETDLTRDKLMQVEWDEDLIEQVFQTSITIEYINAVGVLPHLLRVISDAEGIIGDMSTYRKDSTSSVMELKIGVQSLEHLNGIIKSLKILPNVLTVSRHTYSSSRNSHAKNQMVPS